MSGYSTPKGGEVTGGVPLNETRYLTTRLIAVSFRLTGRLMSLKAVHFTCSDPSQCAAIMSVRGDFVNWRVANPTDIYGTQKHAQTIAFIKRNVKYPQYHQLASRS